MKRAAALVLLLLLLGGCAGSAGEVERGMAFRSKLLAADGCSFHAEITADYGDKLYSFSMECQADAQGNLSFAVVQPETIAGITGSISENGGKLTFDDTALQFDLMADGQVSPVSAPWVLLKALRSGYLSAACIEDAQLRLTLDDSYDDDALQLDIWFDSEDVPQYGEILYDGRKILSVKVTNFVFQ